MDPLMEKELELAARRRGVTKSQFIIEAVERALGRKDPAALYQQVMESAATYSPAEAASPEVDQPLRAQLRTKQEAEAADWLAYQQAKQRGEPWPPAGGEPTA
jgi:RHH-type rel operon transcriptional repressor/antitoxin RelB